jgi:hypothetical protein
VTTSSSHHLERNLRLVRSGRVSRAAGIRRCPDCATPFIDDHSGLSWCPQCRLEHTRHCRTCPNQFTNTAAGDDQCLSCRNQPTLFEVTP